MGWCAGCNPSSVLDGIRLYGLPASPTETHRRLFALPPRRTAVSPFPSEPTRRLNTPQRHRLSGRIVSVPEPGLSPHALRRCGLCGGRSFPRHPQPVLGAEVVSDSHPPAHQPIETCSDVLDKDFGSRLLPFLSLLCLVSRRLSGESGNRVD